MKLHRLGLHAFGRFRGRTIELSPGLNLIYGHNEAGKSTIQKFILGMLYGFKKPDGQRREYTEDLQRYMPWEGDEYRGTMVYELENGRHYRVERDFHPKREAVRLFDEITGQDVTSRYGVDRRRELLFAEEQLRVPEEVFVSTAWVGQLEVSRLQLARELMQRVSNLQDSGREDTSVRQAMRILEEEMRAIGSEKAPTRPYARVVRLIREKEQDLARALALREETLHWEVGLCEVREQLADTDRRIANAQMLQEWALLREERQRLAKAEAMAEEVGEVRARAAMLGQWAEFPVQARDTLLRMEGEAQNAKAQYERHTERLSELESQRDALVGELQQYRNLQGISSEMVSQVTTAYSLYRQMAQQVSPIREEIVRLQDMVEKIEETLQPLKSVVSQGDDVVSRLETIDKEIASTRPRADTSQLEGLRANVQALEKKWRSVGGYSWLAYTVLLSYVGAALYVGKRLSYGIDLMEYVTLAFGKVDKLIAAGVTGLLALLGLLVFVGKQIQVARIKAEWLEAKDMYEAAKGMVNQAAERLVSLEREKERVLVSAGAVTLGELKGRLVRYEQLAARRDGYMLRLQASNSEVVRLQEEAAKHRRVVQGALARYQGVSTDEVMMSEETVDEFRSAFERFSEMRSRWEALSREVEEVTRRQQEEMTRARRALQERQAALDQAGVRSTEDFEKGVASREQYLKIKAEADRMEAVLKEHLAGETLETLEHQVHKRATRLVGDEPPEVPAPAQVQQLIRKLEQQKGDLSAQIGALNARIETALKDLPDLAELEREIALLREEKEMYDRKLSALELAADVLGEVSAVVHREFAPKLNTALGGVVEQLTGGKYKRVRVDEKMGLRALTDDDKLVDVLNLSSGTIDQFYFALRFALIDMITDGQEKIPLILDDPFVQYDERRLAHSMQFLLELAKQYQIILCTCHQREMRVLKELDPTVSIVNISDTVVEA